LDAGPIEVDRFRADETVTEVDMNKRLVMTVAAVALLATGSAWAQTSGKVGVGTGTTVETNKPSVGSSTTGSTGVGTSARPGDTGLGGAARSETTGSSGSAGTGLSTGAGGTAGGNTGVGVGVDGKVGAGGTRR
jgi:hypothetical protein